jgi:hypothetical protein
MIDKQSKYFLVFYLWFRCSEWAMFNEARAVVTYICVFYNYLIIVNVILYQECLHNWRAQSTENASHTENN